MPNKTSDIPKFGAYPIFTVRNGESIPGARELLNYLRDKIFAEHSTKAMFAMLNKKNVEYTAEYPHVPCHGQVVSKLRDYGMLADCALVKRMISGKYPTQAFLILKPSKRGSEWMMLYLRKA